MALAPDDRSLHDGANAGLANAAVLHTAVLAQQQSVSEPLNDSTLALCCCCLRVEVPHRSCALHCGLAGDIGRLLHTFIKTDALHCNCILFIEYRGCGNLFRLHLTFHGAMAKQDRRSPL